MAAALIYGFGNKKDNEGKVIWNPWHLADPICTYLFSILVMTTTFKISRDCLVVLMEGIPKDFD